MSYDRDPARWTASPEEAPELLRGAFSAARDEGPSRAQMRSLALKIAAASAGGAVAVGTVKAASAGQAVASAASWSVGKIVSVVALAGSIVTGALVLQNSAHEPAQEQAVGARGGQAVAAGTEAETSERTTAVAPAVEELAPSVRADQPRVEPLGRSAQPAPSARASGPGPVSARAGQGKAAPSGKLSTSAARSQASAKTARALRPTPSAQQGSVAAPELKADNSGPTRQLTEIELLRRAQVALQSRPQEAFQLTQEHRRLYPAGEFAQERDALAIQALMRAGDSEKARDLAEAFIRKHPGSPHAHRFREALGIR